MSSSSPYSSKTDLTGLEHGFKDDKADEALDWKPSTQQLLIIITLAVTCLLVALDASVIVTALSDIVVDLKGDTTQGFWVGTSYLLVNAVSMPILASFSDIFGRPLCLEFSLVMFTLGTALCCAAQGMGVLLVGRCIQGVGGGGIQVLSSVVLTDFVPCATVPSEHYLAVDLLYDVSDLRIWAHCHALATEDEAEDREP
ncbi:Efflux pump FUS6 [Apiospora arundinis]